MKIRLYHGSQDELVEPKYGSGQDHHDFGKGFYLTDSPELAKEWSVYRPKSHDGWVHAFDLDMRLAVEKIAAEVSPKAAADFSKASGATKQGDGKPWTPAIAVKGGTSGFYTIKAGN